MRKICKIKVALWLGPINLIKCFQRRNMKETSRQQELRWTDIARKIAKESRQDLKKGGENDAEQCHEVMQVKQKGDETITNSAVKQREKELEKGGVRPQKLTQRTTELQN